MLKQLAAVLSLASLANLGCVEPFNGSELEMTVANLQPSETVTAGMLTPRATHYEIWVTQNDVIFPVLSFKVVPSVNVSDPCAIDYAGPEAGMGIVDASKAREAAAKAAGNVTAELGNQDQQGRITRVQGGLKSVTSYQPGNPSPDPAIAMMAPAERLAACKAFLDANPEYYVGNYRVLTSPSGGALRGLVDGNDPDSTAFVGGLIFLTPYNLANAAEIFITLENDDNPGTRGPVILSGQFEERNRGVRSAAMTSPLILGGTMRPAGTVGVYSEFHKDRINF